MFTRKRSVVVFKSPLVSMFVPFVAACQFVPLFALTSTVKFAVLLEVPYHVALMRLIEYVKAVEFDV
jgi:hypothetical protein